MDDRLMPVAPQVTIPQLGERILRIKKAPEIVNKSTYNLEKEMVAIPALYLREISRDFTFTEDVVRERGPETLPYPFYPEAELFQTRDLLRSQTKYKRSTGRQTPRSHNPRHFFQGENFETHTNSRQDSNKTSQQTQRSHTSKTREKTKGVSSHVTPSSSHSHAYLSLNDDKIWEEVILTKLSHSSAERLASRGSGDTRERRLLVGRETRERENVNAPQSHKRGNSHAAYDEPTLGLTCYTQAAEPKQRNYRDEVVMKQLLPVHQSEDDRIRLDNDTVYEKRLAVSFPQEPKQYSTDTEQFGTPKYIIHGHRRWKALPVLTEDQAGSNWNPPTRLGLDSASRVAKSRRRKLIKSSSSTQIVDELQANLGVKTKWTSTTVEQLARDVKSINDPIRLAAITACAYASRFSLKDKSSMSDSPLPAVLYEGVRGALNDENELVRLAASVTLFTLGMPCGQSKKVLLETLEKGQGADCWTAAQCLARAGVGHLSVVRELVGKISSEGQKQQIAAKLLAQLSRTECLVHMLIAEQLNSANWKNRAAACSIIPSLRPPLSKEVARKIVDLMWNDWNSDVRQAAGQALGRTGQGKLVHDELRLRLRIGNEMAKLDALQKIGSLGLMTGRLLPSFLSCFKAEYVSIRLEAAKVAGLLHIKDTQVVKCLMKLMDDAIGVVKARAIQSLGLIGMNKPGLTDKLLWSMRFEKDSLVRAEACHTLQMIKVDDDRVVLYLKDLLTLDSDPSVRHEAAMALQAIGESPTADEGMADQVRVEVQKLGTVPAITQSILTEANDKKIERHRCRLLGIQKCEQNTNREDTEIVYRQMSVTEDGRESSCTLGSELLRLDGTDNDVRQRECGISNNEPFDSPTSVCSTAIQLQVAKSDTVSFDLCEGERHEMVHSGMSTCAGFETLESDG